MFVFGKAQKPMEYFASWKKLIGFPSAPLLSTPLPGVFALLPYPEKQNQSQARWPTSIIPDSRGQDRKILMNFKASMSCGINILPL